MCKAVLVNCHVEYRELCEELNCCTVIYNTSNCVYNFTGEMLYTAKGIACTAVLVYSYIEHRQ